MKGHPELPSSALESETRIKVGFHSPEHDGLKPHEPRPLNQCFDQDRRHALSAKSSSRGHAADAPYLYRGAATWNKPLARNHAGTGQHRPPRIDNAKPLGRFVPPEGKVIKKRFSSLYRKALSQERLDVRCGKSLEF